MYQKPQGPLSCKISSTTGKLIRTSYCKEFCLPKRTEWRKKNLRPIKRKALNTYHCTLHYVTHQVKPKSINLQNMNKVNTVNS